MVPSRLLVGTTSRATSSRLMSAFSSASRTAHTASPLVLGKAQINPSLNKLLPNVQFSSNPSFRAARPFSTADAAAGGSKEPAEAAAEGSKEIRKNPPEFDVKILPGGVRQLKKLLSNQPDRFLRFTVNSGGCSGYQYEFRMDPIDSLNKNGDDVLFEQDGVQMVVDELSLEFLGSCEVDFTSEMIRSSFQVVKNSSAENNCGCGASFSVGSAF